MPPTDDAPPGTAPPLGEFYVAFSSKAFPGKLTGVRVRIDQTIHDADGAEGLDKRFNVALVDHPLYPQLAAYVLANPPPQGCG